MRTKLFFICGFFLLSALGCVSGQQKNQQGVEAKADSTGYIVRVGDEAPDFTVTLTDGRALSAEVHTARGAPSRPLGEAEMLAKFIDCTGRAEVPLAKGMAHELAQDIAALEHCPNVGALFAF